MKVALIQMNSQENKAANLTQAKQLVERAVAEERPDLVVLPELFTMLSESVDAKRSAAEDLPGGEAYEMLRNLASTHRIILHGGSFLERAGDKFYNTTVVFDRAGKELARYRKIHLFDVDTPDGKSYRESATMARGTEVVAYQAGDRTIGCSICYDVRFPELYQALAKKGAEIIAVPAAFTLQTGRDHWEVLLRARAIETETYVLAAGQCGSYANGQRQNFGHTLVANPWGHITAMAADKVGYIATRLDFDYLKQVRQAIPVASHKVL
ncbi:MAG: carbon-nitrogen hydrolase family protein [Burkholderiales bacterium]|nr:carbon-nitrogen hydrolase family protein [Burkholderiales bacterium]